MNNFLWVSGFNLFGIEVKFYGILMASAFIIGLFLLIKYCKFKGYDENLPYELLLVIFPSSIIGARLNYILFTLDRNWTFLEMLSIWHGGLMIYGGVLFSVVALAIFCKIKKISFIAVLDMLAPLLILGQAIGRWGNFFNQEAYGSLITNPSFQWFPFGVYIESSHFTDEARQQVLNAFGSLSGVDGAWFNATFFYESIWCFGGFVLLHNMFKKTDTPGLLSATYLAYYGIERFFVEMLRTDSLYLGGIKISVLVSAVIFVAGLSYLIYLYVKNQRLKKLKLSADNNVAVANKGSNGNMQTKNKQ